MTTWRMILRMICAAAFEFMAAACTGRGIVTPGRFDTFLNPGDRDNFTLHVNLVGVPTSFVPIDIVFLLDATGSMRNIIETMRGNAITIVQQMRQANPNTAFGVASFGDYGSTDPVWTLDQDITQDTTRVVAALQNIRMVDGGDLPEAYSSALYEMLFLSWRPSAQRYVVLFGDAPAHDPDFYGKNLGIDPGSDGIPGTVDDLRFRDVVHQLATSKITVIGVYDRGPWYNRKELGEETRVGFEFAAKETGGIAVPVTAADEVPNAIRQGFEEVRRPAPVMKAGSRYASWQQLSAAELDDETGLHYSFPLSVVPPASTAPGMYDIPLQVMASEASDAEEIGRSVIRVRIGWMHYHWRWPLMAILLFLLACIALAGAMRRSRLMPTGSRMLASYSELGLLWRGSVVFVIAGLIVFVIIALPETPMELGRVDGFDPEFCCCDA
jgi:hypothetical protein